MPQAQFAHAPVHDAAGVPLSVSIFADDAPLREQLADDIAATGLGLKECARVADLSGGGQPRPLADVVVLECPVADAPTLAALARLDLRARRAGAHLIVATSAAALEDVFACCDHSAPQILVEPTRAERIMAVGRALARIPRLCLHELSQSDRAALLQLTEQLAELAGRIDPATARSAIRGEDRVLRFESPVQAYAAAPAARTSGVLPDAGRSLFPDPRRVRHLIRQRQMRARFFDAQLFADPAWDILLDLTAAEAEHARVSVTSLCIASGVPATTALRWIGQMVEAGLLRRVADEADRRRAFITLSDEAIEGMARYFAALDPVVLPQG